MDLFSSVLLINVLDIVILITVTLVIIGIATIEYIFVDVYYA